MRPGGGYFPPRGGSRLQNTRHRGNSSIGYALRAGLLILMAVLYGAFMIYVIAPHGTGRSTDDGALANGETDYGHGDFPDLDWMEAGASMPRVIDRRKVGPKTKPLPQETDAQDGRLDSIEASEEQFFDSSLPTVLVEEPPEPDDGDRPGCKDTNDGCASWAASGECQANPGFMIHGCKASCGLCKAPRVSETVTLRGAGISMPSVGFGTAGLGAQTGQAASWAYEAGYRHFDSAQAREWYREDLVGQALREPLEQRRDELFITSKLHPRDLGYNRTTSRVSASLEDLHTDHLDLFLLHYPRCWDGICSGEPEGTWKDSWRALEDLWDRGVLKAIGVSNFNAEELEEAKLQLPLVKLARVKPHVVQANSDPFNPNEDLQDACRMHGIQFVAYSSLGSQWMMRGYAKNPVLTSPVLQSIAMRHSVSAAQIVLRWALQEGQVVIPRSSKQARIAQNRDIFGFRLDGEDMEAIRRMAGKPP